MEININENKTRIWSDVKIEIDKEEVLKTGKEKIWENRVDKIVTKTVQSMFFFSLLYRLRIGPENITLVLDDAMCTYRAFEVICIIMRFSGKGRKGPQADLKNSSREWGWDTGLGFVACKW